jgi:ferredoxin
VIAMTHVVTEACIKCKYTDCVDLCPVDAFREGPNMLVIDPESCIDCALCVPDCPVDAIFHEADLTPSQSDYVELNASLSQVWPAIIEVHAALPDADQWAGVEVKRHLLESPETPVKAEQEHE